MFLFLRRRQLPSIEEAWNLPISAEMSSRQQQQQQPPTGPGYKYGATPAGPPPPYPQGQVQNLNTKRFKVNLLVNSDNKTISDKNFTFKRAVVK